MEVCIAVFVWKLDIFSFHCYIDHFINQKRSKDINNWNWPGHVIFALSKMTLNSQETLLHVSCLNSSALCYDNSTQTFFKRRMMVLSNVTFLSEFLLSRQVVARLKLHLVELLKILENFSKRKIKSEADFYLLSCCVAFSFLVFSIKVVLCIISKISTLRVASKNWLSVDV